MAIACNDGSNHLHGGQVVFSHRVWNIEHPQTDAVTIDSDQPRRRGGAVPVRLSDPHTTIKIKIGDEERNPQRLFFVRVWGLEPTH